MPRPVIVIQGARNVEEVAGLAALAEVAELRFAMNHEALERQLPGADVLLGWQFRDAGLRTAWPYADALRWIHWCGAGVDALLFPELVASEVTVTNARGIFDRAMAEYTLTLIFASAKRITESAALAKRGYWQHRMTDKVAGKHALIVGAGSIGREIARLLKAAGLTVTIVGRRQRNDGEFGEIHAIDALAERLSEADYVVSVLPSTPATQQVFAAAEFAAMKPTAMFINLGRGGAVIESDLYDALRQGTIGTAALDVFEDEPLPPSHPFWRLENLFISPHMSGDYAGYHGDLIAQFCDNVERYRTGEALCNVIDKASGFAAD